MDIIVFGALSVVIVALMVILPVLLWLPTGRATQRSSRRLHVALVLYTVCGDVMLLTPLSLAITMALRAAGTIAANLGPGTARDVVVTLLVVNGGTAFLLIVAAAIDPRLRQGSRRQ